MSNDEKQKELTDVYEVAILSVQGIKYKTVILTNGRVKFTYDRLKEVEDVIQQFYDGTLTVNPQEYKHSIQDIRSVIYSLKRN